MNKIDAFFISFSLLLAWLFAIYLLPYWFMIIVYVAIASWTIGKFIGNLPRKMSKETDRDFLNKMYKVMNHQNKTMGEMLECLAISRAANLSLLARIDELMFEYCPEEMTKAQIANYEAHVRAATPEEKEAVNRALH